MQRFTPGDQVRIDIPDTTDPDHGQFHGEYGLVTEILRDDTGATTGDERDSILYHVELDDGREMDFRWRDLRPA